MNSIIYENVDLINNNQPILQNINLEVKQGDILYFVGQTGSGKSTFFKSLYADHPIKKGRAIVLGEDLTTLKKNQILALRRKMGIVFQDFQLLDDRSIYDNIAFAWKITHKESKLDESIVQNVLKTTGTKHLCDKKPFELSGGEQQKVCIARALVNNPKLIIADEPTGNLDPKTSKEIIDLLHQINQKGTTVLISTHDKAILSSHPAKTICVENQQLLV